LPSEILNLPSTSGEPEQDGYRENSCHSKELITPEESLHNTKTLEIGSGVESTSIPFLDAPDDFSKYFDIPEDSDNSESEYSNGSLNVPLNFYPEEVMIEGEDEMPSEERSKHWTDMSKAGSLGSEVPKKPGSHDVEDETSTSLKHDRPSQQPMKFFQPKTEKQLVPTFQPSPKPS
jgi:hypothetical protein